MSDLGTMIWKEAKDLLFAGRWGPWIRPLILIGLVGVVLPWRAGLPWLELAPGTLLVLLWVPFVTIITFIGDAIAGERERHTLETLLASRMPDWAILLGKVIVTVGYAWGLALVSLLVGPLVVNLSSGQGLGNWAFYGSWELFLYALALCLLVSLLPASAGVLISLRVATVRQAQQILSMGMLVFIFGGILGLSALPPDLLSAMSSAQLLLFILAGLALLDAILLGLAFMSFRRSHLILS
jgi:ABC-2 type transport system permease protein